MKSSSHKFFLFVLVLISTSVFAQDNSIGLKILLKKGQQLSYKGYFLEAQNAFERGLNQSLKQADIYYLANFYLETADLYLLLNKVDSIESYYAHAAYLSEVTGQDKINLRARIGLLEMKRRVGPSATMEYYLDLLKEAQTAGDTDAYYIVLDKVMTVNYAMQNYVCISQAFECLNYYTTIGDSVKAAIKTRNIGSMYNAKGQIDSSILMNEKALAEFKRLKNPYFMAQAYQSLAWNIYDKGEVNKEKALTYITIAEEIDRKYNFQLTQLYLVKSFVMYQHNRFQDAIESARVSYNRGFKAKQLFIVFQSAYFMAHYFKKLNAIDSAMFYTERYAFIKDSIRSEKQYQDAGKMQAQLEFSKDQLKQDLLKEAELNKKQLIINFSLLGFALVLGIAFLLFRAYKISKKNADVIAQKNYEKELLLKEIHHRVKNNLSIVSGILDMQERKLNNPELSHIFRDAKNRMGSIAMVHQTLYEQEDFGKLDAGVYMEHLYKNVYSSYKREVCKVDAKIDGTGLQMEPDVLVPLALIVNEMLTNSFKYAFQDREVGQIHIQLKEEKGIVSFTYSDDGPGLPQTTEVKAKASLGTMLLNGLSKQLSGELKQMSSSAGLMYQLSFPLS
ncbi:MAG: hypothetical protein CFE21_03110 [Bacteroidetes bacterium B1(2017)]|nr:MAG: hypothetical protein CFE21_03110 [Bacteroidetes bacterium B1(2017)]